MISPRKTAAVLIAAALMLCSGCGNTYEIVEETPSVPTAPTESGKYVSFAESGSQTSSLPEASEVPDVSEAPLVSEKSSVLSGLSGTYRTHVGNRETYVTFFRVNERTVIFSVGCIVDGDSALYETETVSADAGSSITFDWTDNWLTKGTGVLDLSSAPDSVVLTVTQTAEGKISPDPVTTDGKPLVLTK